MCIKKKRNKNKINGYLQETYVIPKIRQDGGGNGDKGGPSLLNKSAFLERGEK